MCCGVVGCCILSPQGATCDVGGCCTPFLQGATFDVGGCCTPFPQGATFVVGGCCTLLLACGQRLAEVQHQGLLGQVCWVHNQAVV